MHCNIMRHGTHRGCRDPLDYGGVHKRDRTATWDLPARDFHGQPPEPGQPGGGTHPPHQCLPGHHANASSHTRPAIPCIHCTCGRIPTSEFLAALKRMGIHTTTREHENSNSPAPPHGTHLGCTCQPWAQMVAPGTAHMLLPSPPRCSCTASARAPAPPTDGQTQHRFRGDRTVLSSSETCRIASSPISVSSGYIRQGY